MKVLLFGARGYLGQHVAALYSGAATPSVDIADPLAVAAVLDDAQPDVVINLAGKTGRPNIDWCEDHKEETVRSNVTGPLVLLEECAKRDIYWVHLSSGCIYQGDASTPFSETDEPNFTGSFYSRTKAIIDKLLQEFPACPGRSPGVLIVRPRMPFDGTQSPRSLISKVSKYERVLDVPNSMTYVPDFLKAMEALIAKRATGVYNVVNPGAMSPYQIMQKYQEIVDPNHTFDRLTLGDLPAVTAAGRSNCILSTEKLQSAGVAMRPIEEAVEEALHTLAKQCVCAA